MIRIYTSYFGNVKNIKDKKLISIANSTPINDCIIAKRYWPAMVPAWRTTVQPIKLHQIDETEYTIRYMQQLEQINVSNLFNWLMSMSQGKDIVLLCYETPDKFCHRHILAKWLNEAFKDAGLNIETIEEL